MSPSPFVRVPHTCAPFAWVSLIWEGTTGETEPLQLWLGMSAFVKEVLGGVSQATGSEADGVPGSGLGGTPV